MIEMGRIADALKKKYSSPKVALRALGLDESLLDDQEQEMANQFNQQAYRKAYLAAMDAARKMIALDAKRARDEGEGVDPEMVANMSPEAKEELAALLLAGMDPEAEDRVFSKGRQYRSADALHRRADDDLYESYNDRPNIGGWAGGDRRRTARDEPPPFAGRPRPGGSTDPMSADRRRAEDRRRHLGADSMYALPTGYTGSRSHDEMFPQARRIGFLG